MSSELKGLDTTALDRWLPEALPELTGPFTYRHLSGGHSNLSYRIDDFAAHSLVLRRPPVGKLPSKAHDVSREYHICKALQSTAIPVPEMKTLCTDSSVIGSIFYIMTFIEGAVPESPSIVKRAFPSPQTRTIAAENLITALVGLHQVDVDEVGLGHLGRRNDYLSRQLGRMIDVWNRTKTRELDEVDRLHRRLVELQPAQRYTGLVHSDYRLGNIMFDENGKLLGILDWELCAIGDVLVDLGFLLNSWDSSDDPFPGAWMEEPPTRAGDFPDRDWLIERYGELSGFDVDDIDYYRAFCYWRIAIIADGIKRRYMTGALQGDVDPDFVEERVRKRLALAKYYLNRAASQT